MSKWLTARLQIGARERTPGALLAHSRLFYALYLNKKPITQPYFVLNGQCLFSCKPVGFSLLYDALNSAVIDRSLALVLDDPTHKLSLAQVDHVTHAKPNIRRVIPVRLFGVA